MTIDEIWLSKQKLTAEYVAQEIKRRCVRAKQKPPSFNTVRDRIRARNKQETIKQREGTKAARRLSALGEPQYGGIMDASHWYIDATCTHITRHNFLKHSRAW